MDRACIDFNCDITDNKPLVFDGFERIIAAHKIEDVLPALNLIQQFANEGYYAVGFVAYEAAGAFDSALQVNEKVDDVPLLLFGLSKDVSHAAPDNAGDFSFDNWQPQWDRSQYQEKFNKVQNHLNEGDSYQVNLTFPLKSKFSGDSMGCYTFLKRAQNCDFCGFMEIDGLTIISASPELFFQKNGNTIRTRPMKGTAKRGLTYKEDIQIRDEMCHSEKQMAENLMIVDLLRNDLGRIAQIGTVNVTELLTAEKYPTVWQLTSTIQAKLNDNIKLPEIFKALFPCGSVTGAPKVRTMKIIRELETAGRGVYCGAFGLVTPGGNCVFNVPIRTVTIKENNAVYNVGSGVVADSDGINEYDECLLKSKVLLEPKEKFDLLETICYKVNGGFVLLDEHFDRLNESAQYFGWAINCDMIKSKLMARALQWDCDKLIRLLVSNDGTFKIQDKNLNKIFDGALKVKLANTCIDSNDMFLYHKTTRRDVYDRFRTELGDAFDILLYNQRDELTESTIANVAVCFEGKWYSPPIKCGLLAGVKRRELLENGKIVERIIKIDELKEATGIKLFNSVRGEINVSLLPL
ncbi:MAG: aminodeoxychorismate synthase component I [Phycisphaerae bacterium]|nr:aminodeoxychorismate synthase component I [Phycisphaerae bacterium]